MLNMTLYDFIVTQLLRECTYTGDHQTKNNYTTDREGED